MPDLVLYIMIQSSEVSTYVSSSKVLDSTLCSGNKSAYKASVQYFNFSTSVHESFYILFKFDVSFVSLKKQAFSMLRYGYFGM